MRWLELSSNQPSSEHRHQSATESREQRQRAKPEQAKRNPTGSLPQIGAQVLKPIKSTNQTRLTLRLNQPEVMQAHQDTDKCWPWWWSSGDYKIGAYELAPTSTRMARERRRTATAVKAIDELETKSIKSLGRVEHVELIDVYEDDDDADDGGIHTKTSSGYCNREQLNCCRPASGPNKHDNQAGADGRRDNRAANREWKRWTLGSALLALGPKDTSDKITFSVSNSSRRQASERAKCLDSSTSITVKRKSSLEMESIREKKRRQEVRTEEEREEEHEKEEEDQEVGQDSEQKQRKHSKLSSSKRQAGLTVMLVIGLFLLAATTNTLAPFSRGPSGCSAQVLRAMTAALTGGNQQVAQATNSPPQSPSGSVGCPYPAVNPNCQVNIIAQAPAVPLLNTEFVADEYSTLKPDTQAAYKCDHGYELIGSEQVTCLASGRWSASPPNCVTNIAIGKPTNQSSTVRGGDSKNANDGKLITQHDSKYCTETKVDQSPWWQIDLLQVYEIRSIRILGRACCNPHLSLHDIEIRVGNSSTLQGNRLCAWYPNNLDEGTSRDFQCAHPILGRFVSIQMVGIESALSLCEVMVFSTKEFHPDRCGIQPTLGPSLTSVNRASQSSVTTTTSATTTQQTNNPSAAIGTDNQIIVFNRTCYETQATNGGSFLVADTYCKARGGSLIHSINDLTQAFISQELERMKPKLKSKLVWLGAKRENASPNAQGPITPGSTSALVASDSVHHTFVSDRSLSASLHEFPIESLFSNDHGLISTSETSSIFSPAVKLSRSALLQASTGAGGSTSRGSQTFGLQTNNNHHHHPSNGSVTHSGRSLIISQPSQVASFFTPPVPISNSMSPSSSNLAPTLVSPTHSSPSTTSSSASPSSPISFASPNNHVHRTLRPPSLVSTQSPSAAISSWNPSRVESTTSQSSAQSSSIWRWVGDGASDTIMSPVTSFLWADDQPNNYNNQQDCIVLDGGKKWLWNDVTCELDYLPWVCQYRPSTCGSPDRNENSTILEMSSSSSEDGSSEKAFQLGKVVTYACPVGHRLDGPKTRKCLYDGSWSGKAPKCQYINCGPIGSQTIENGRAVYLNQSQTTFGSQVRYVCYEDYVLVGDDTRQCQSDGKWGGKQPFCAYKWCPVLQQISNGQLNVSSYSENSVATYQCNSGYKLIGNDTRQCLLGGKWTNQEPFCQYVDCGQPKQIPNSSHELVNGTTNYLSVAAYTCNENYTLVGANNKMVCSHNNRWTGREPQCTLIDCGQPQANAGSRFTGDSFSVHSTIEYKCDPGFKEVSGSTQRTCGLDGQWTGQPLTCKYVDCGRVPAILKGEVSYINGTTYLASQISYECTPGNRISGHRVRFCGPDARWTGTSPKCEEVRCDAPEMPANGSAVYIGNDRSFKEQSFSVGVTVQYECDYGHVVKGSWSSRLCQANGEWSGEPPVCKFVDCGQPHSIENGNYLLKHPPAGASVGSATPIELSRRSDGGANSGSGSVGTFTYYGTIAHYNCDTNYKLQGPAQRECLESGQWRTPLPTCEPIQCPKPEFFDEYTQVTLIPKGSQQQVAMDMVQQTPTGLDHQSVMAMLATVKSIKLIANNQWLNQHANQSFSVGDKLHYSCMPGYELYGGPELRTCTQYAQWSGSSTPRCRLIDCGRPAPIGQEGRYYLLNETTTFNSLVEYSCVRPFKLVEVKIRQAGNLIETLMNAQAGVTPILTSLPIGVKVCANNGQWMPNDQQPKCTTGGGGGGSMSAGQFDGGDNTLDGTNRQVHVLTNSGAGGSTRNSHPSFVNINGGDSNQDGDNNSLGEASSSGQQQTGSSSQSAYFWAKVLLVISLPLMFAIITVTLICIRSNKKPKQAMHRASILTSSGHQAATAMQIQLASSGKGLQQQQQQQQQQQSLMVQPAHNHHHHHHGVGHAPSMLPGQNIYINGMQKMFPGSMVGQSQMSSGAAGLHLDHRHQHSNMIPASYGDAMLVGQTGANLAGVAGRPVPTSNGRGEILLNGKSSSLGIVGGGGGARLRSDQATSASSMDSYSRLSIESDQNNGQTTGLGNKTIRHNPNGLVTFVSPIQQQQQKSSNSNSQQHLSTSSSASSGVSSSSHQHQISPQSISTSLSVSSSSSSPTSSSNSSAHHTNATRLSNSSDANDGHLDSHHHHQHHLTAHDQQQQSEYEAPQQFSQQVSAPVPINPPSLPAHPPPPHRVQQQFKQLMKHQQSPAAGKQATRVSSSLSHSQANNKQQQQANLAQDGNDGQSEHNYMEPGV